jgi:hypothetical protein
MMEMLCAPCIAWNTGHKISLALRRDPVEEAKLWENGVEL